MRTLTETKRAHFAEIRPEDTAHGYDEHHTEYNHHCDDGTAENILFICHRLFTDGGDGNAFSLAAVLLNAARGATLFVSRAGQVT